MVLSGIFSTHRIDSVFRFYSTEMSDIRRRHSSHMGVDHELHDTNALRRGEVQVETPRWFFNSSVEGT